MFRVLKSADFPPFGKFRMEFPRVENKPPDLAEVHLLTGVNGTGKTRLLALLAALLGGGEALKRRLRKTDGAIGAFASGNLGAPAPARPEWVGGGSVRLAATAPFQRWLKNVPAFAYHGLAYVSDVPIAAVAAVPRPERAECLSFCRTADHSSALLQAIAGLKMQAAMDSLDQSAGTGATHSRQIVRALEDTLTRITDQPFVFQVTTYPQPTLQVKWASVPMPFDFLPDGLRSIIGWLVDAEVMMDAMLRGKGSPAEREAVFLLDEIESHLHPVWQRRVLPAFQRLFPKAQIFVATHSPFVIASLNSGWIHAFRLENDGTVKVPQPKPASAGDSYISVLEDIMGLEEMVRSRDRKAPGRV